MSDRVKKNSDDMARTKRTDRKRCNGDSDRESKKPPAPPKKPARKQSDKKFGDFVCPTCSIHFNQASNRKRHMAIAHEENEDQTPADPAFVAKVRAYNTKGCAAKNIPAAAGAPTPSTSTQPATEEKKTTAKNIPKSVEIIESSSEEYDDDPMSDVEPEDAPATSTHWPSKTAVVRPEPIQEERSTLDEDLMLSDSASDYDVSIHGEESEPEDVVDIDVAAIEVPQPPTPTTSLPAAVSSSQPIATTSAPHSSHTRRPWERQPTRPAPLSTAIRRLRTVVQAPAPVPRPAPETFEHYRRRTREVTANRIVCTATNYSKSVRQCVTELSDKFSLRPEERTHCTKSVRIARLSQKRLATLIRRQFRFASNSATKDTFLNWLVDTLVDIEARSSDSDDN